MPEEDWDKIFEWTEVLVGADDPEFRLPGESPGQATRRISTEWFHYNNALIEQRQREGLGDDLLSDLLRAEIDGRKLSPAEIHGYFVLLLAAGNETTRNSISGGVKALLDHPEQAQMLVDDASLVPSAVEEMLRWTSIVIQFQRTAVQDVELRGKQIRKGESVVLWYPSANRDEDIFEDPYRFDITRKITTTSRSAATVSISVWARIWPAGRCVRSSTRCARCCRSWSWPRTRST